MAAAGKKYDPVIYDGAGHGFMRAGEDPTNTNPANTTARTQALARLKPAQRNVAPTAFARGYVAGCPILNANAFQGGIARIRINPLPR